MSRFDGMEEVLFFVACGALISFPTLLLPVPSAANTGFSVLLGWSLVTFAYQRRAGLAAWRDLLLGHWPLVLAMAALPLAMFFHRAVTGDDLHVPYLYLRFGLFALLAWGLLQLGSEALKWIQWGFVIGAISSAIWIHFAAEHGRPEHVGISNVIPFANLSLLMGMLALISVGWSRRDQYLGIALKVVAGFAGLYTSYLSGTRGSWLAIPVLLLIVLAASRKLTGRTRVLILALAFGGVSIGGYCSGMVRERVGATTRSLIKLMTHSLLDTSEGMRLQLWNASVHMLRDFPLRGVGPEHFHQALQAMVPQGLITPTAAMFAHSHNDLLYAAATLGIPGLVAVALLYVVPAAFFLRYLACDDAATSVAALMGLATSVGFFMFGLTEAMFYISMTNAFYTLVIATCFAFIVSRAQAGAHRPGCAAP